VLEETAIVRPVNVSLNHWTVPSFADSASFKVPHEVFGQPLACPMVTILRILHRLPTDLLPIINSASGCQSRQISTLFFERWTARPTDIPIYKLTVFVSTVRCHCHHVVTDLPRIKRREIWTLAFVIVRPLQLN
jgi:hypothetical protein